jgi:hypothetical protein
MEEKAGLQFFIYMVIIDNIVMRNRRVVTIMIEKLYDNDKSFFAPECMLRCAR